MYPGCLAHVVSGMFYSVVADRRQPNYIILFRAFFFQRDIASTTRRTIGHCAVYNCSCAQFIHQFIRRCNPYATTSASQVVLSGMQLTIHATRRTPHGASRLVLEMSAWSVKARRAPSRHCRDAWVYGHTTTVMHDSEYTFPPHCAPPLLFL